MELQRAYGAKSALLAVDDRQAIMWIFGFLKQQVQARCALFPLLSALLMS